MPQLRLCYFDFDYGRAEPARIALSIADLPFEDDRIPYNDWLHRKDEMPFGAIPVLYVDGRPLAQSDAINRYVGKLAGLYPEDPWQAAMCDEVMGVVEDSFHQITHSFGLPEPETKARRALMDTEILPRYMKRLGQILEENGREFFADNRLTVGDLKVADWVQALQSGQLEYVRDNLPQLFAPSLVEHAARVKADPRVKAYYDRRAAVG